MQKITVFTTVFLVLGTQFNVINSLTCWNAKCTWDTATSARSSCTLESIAQCTGLYCVSYFLNSTIEAIQCLDNIPILSGMTSCNTYNKCICSSTVSTIACPNATAPAVALASGGQAYTIYVNENTAKDIVVATFKAVNDSNLAITLSVGTSIPTTFSTYFYLSDLSLLVNSDTLDYETMYANGESVFTISLSASNGVYSSTTIFSVVIVDINETPTSCTDALGNTLVNNTVRVLYVSSSTVPLGATLDVDTITCTDPDVRNANYRIVNATLTDFFSTFTTPCTASPTSSSTNTTTNQCILRANVGAEFYYYSRTSYSPIWIITQQGSSFSLTTTSSIIVNYTNPGLSFNASMPTTITYAVTSFPIAVPHEIFNFGIWTNRTTYQTNLNYTFCGSSCGSTCTQSQIFSVNQYTGKLSLIDSSISDGSYAGCILLTDGTTTTSQSVTISITLIQPPTLKNITLTPMGTTYEVPVVAVSEINVVTITPNSSNGTNYGAETATRYLFYISSFLYDYDAQAFWLNTTDKYAILQMHPYIPISQHPNTVVIKIIAIGSLPSALTVVYIDPINITKTNGNFFPYIDTTPISYKITPNQFSDNAQIAEFYTYIYRGTNYYYSLPSSAPEQPLISFNRTDLVYASLSETESLSVVEKYWYKYQVRLYSLPGTRFDFGPFTINMSVTDLPNTGSSKTSSATLNVYPVDTYMALDSASFNFCFSCDGCDVAFIGVPQRCAINETFCCVRSEPGSRTSRFCSSTLDFSDMVSCCLGKLCNESPASTKQATFPRIFFMGIAVMATYIWPHVSRSYDS